MVWHSNPSTYVLLAQGVVLAAVALISLARSLPLQNVLAIAATLLVGESLITRFECSTASWLQIWASALVWFSMIIIFREVGRILLRGQRWNGNYGFWLLAWCGLATTVLDFFSDRSPLRLAVRFVTTVLLVLVVTPWLLDKRAASQLPQ